MGIELNYQQIQLKKELRHWLKTLNKPYFYYSGRAGTGKTTVIASLIEDLNFSDTEYITVAYVGKAALVLMMKGLRASTIHALIYDVQFRTDIEPITLDTGEIKYRKKRKMEFVKKAKLDERIKVIIVDEMAMANDAILKDLFSFGIPIIFMGDRNQLPPVFGKNSIADNPDFELTQIMRQNEDNPIIYIANRILDGHPFIFGDYKTSKIVTDYDLDERLIKDFDMIICGKNKTRDMFNSVIRNDIMGIKGNAPIIGDRVICRQNNWDECLDGIYLTNGMIGYLRDIDMSALYKNVAYVSFQPEFMPEDKCFDFLEMDYNYLISDHKVRKDQGYNTLNKFEYGNAITTHLSQGSEYPRVFYFDEPFGDDEMRMKLRYTAVTRAVNELTIVAKERQRFY